MYFLTILTIHIASFSLSLRRQQLLFCLENPLNAVCVGSALGLVSEKKLCFPEEQETSSSCSGPDTEGCAGKIHLVSALRCCRESALSLRMNHSSWPSRAKEVDQILMANPLLTECVCVCV